MDDFDKYLKEQMADPEFKKEWDNSELEYQLMMIPKRGDFVPFFGVEKGELRGK